MFVKFENKEDRRAAWLHNLAVCQSEYVMVCTRCNGVLVTSALLEIETITKICPNCGGKLEKV